MVYYIHIANSIGDFICLALPEHQTSCNLFGVFMFTDDRQHQVIGSALLKSKSIAFSLGINAPSIR